VVVSQTSTGIRCEGVSPGESGQGTKNPAEPQRASTMTVMHAYPAMTCPPETAHQSRCRRGREEIVAGFGRTLREAGDRRSFDRVRAGVQAPRARPSSGTGPAACVTRCPCARWGDGFGHGGWGKHSPVVAYSTVGRWCRSPCRGRISIRASQRTAPTGGSGQSRGPDGRRADGGWYPVCPFRRGSAPWWPGWDAMRALGSTPPRPRPIATHAAWTTGGATMPSRASGRPVPG
jgi:hypothetical protein